MSSLHTAQQVLWLDPIQPLDAPEHAQLTAAGLSVRCINTLDELQSALSFSQTQALVIRHDTTLDLLQSCQNLMLRAGCALPVVCRVDRRHLELAVQAMRQGAAHVLATDDWSATSWQMAHQAIQALRLSSSAASMVARMAPPSEVVAAATPQKSVVYVDPASRHLLALAQRVAQANVTALIEGPTGAGKEILARVLHESSKRARGPFVGLNCAALPEQLIDDMLFGHEKGAFTGAQKEFKGLFEQAQGGTLFLDEIGEMPMHLQAKLLRVLQERLLTRLGSERQVAIDVRIIAATNKDLRVAIAEREFREDLYFRISTFKLRVPPLRDRKGDILPLVASLLLRHAPNAQEFTLSDEAQAQLLAYPWPGNVRELENVVQRAVVLCANQHIEVHHLMFDDSADLHMGLSQELAPVPVAEAIPSFNANRATQATSATPVSQFGMPTAALPFPDTSNTEDNTFIGSNLQDAVKSSEHQIILAAIQTTESRMEAAAKLGISPRTLRYKLAKLKAENGTMAWAA
jgi:two-component system response regulator FlrC